MLSSKPSHGGGAPLGIDLDAGVARIKIRSAAPAAPEDDHEVVAPEAPSEPAEDASEPS